MGSDGDREPRQRHDEPPERQGEPPEPQGVDELRADPESRASRPEPPEPEEQRGRIPQTRIGRSAKLGTAIGTQIGFAIAGFSPTIAAALDGEDGTNWLPVAIFTAALCIVNVLAVASGRETSRVPTEQLGTRSSGTTTESVPA